MRAIENNQKRLRVKWEPASHIKQCYSVVPDYADMPTVTIDGKELARSQQRLDKRMRGGIHFGDPAWETHIDLSKRYYRERLVYLTNVEVLMVRFSYNYEVDLDRVHNERDLLSWTLHFTTKTWMTTRRLHYFIEAVASIKHLSIYGL